MAEIPKPKHEGLTIRQIVTQMGDGEHYSAYAPKEPTKCIANVHLNKGLYYVTGPLFSDIFKMTLANILKRTQAEEGHSALQSALIINEGIDEHGNSVPEAKIYMCNDLEDALDTLQGLLMAYR